MDYSTYLIGNLLFIALLGLLTLGVGCSNAVSITTDYDKEADFTQYKTFGFLQWNAESAALVNDLDRRRLENAVAAQLKKRGMKRSEGMGDTMIGFHVVVEEKTGTTSYTEHYGSMGYYGVGFGYGYGYPYGGVSTTQTSSYTYVVGTIVIDQYEASSKKLVWEGVAQGVLEEDKSNREEKINENTRRMFENYPVSAVTTSP